MNRVAITAVETAMRQAMLPFLGQQYGNPSSVHRLGGGARRAIDTARNQLAALVGVQPFEVYFAPTAALSNNVAILGRARFVQANELPRRFAAGPPEGEGILQCLKRLQADGWQVETITDHKQLSALGTGDKDKPCVHYDASRLISEQSAELKLSSLPADTLTLAGASLHPALSIAALVVKRGVNVMPVVFGGGQEFGLFPGTEPVAAIVGFGAAAEAWLAALTSAPDG